MVKPKILAILPARGGRKRIPKKNIKDIVKEMVRYELKHLSND